jgi:hypothetical protein
LLFSILFSPQNTRTGCVQESKVPSPKCEYQG